MKNDAGRRSTTVRRYRAECLKSASTRWQTAL
jgi:hypothetical protein